MTKNIWVFSHDAEPPDGNWTNPFELFKVLSTKGHRITVFCSSFSHHTRKDVRLQAGERFKEQYFNGVRFIFIKTIPYFNNGWRRYLNYLSYAIRGFWVSKNYKERPDAIIGATPQPLCAFLAFMIARKKETRFLLEVSDLWPKFFVEIGAFSEWHPVTIVLRWMERFLFQKANHILTFWPKMDLYIQRFGIPPEKITWMPMGIDCKELSNIEKTPGMSAGRFLVMYRGRFGMTQDMLAILRAAKIIQDEGFEDIHFMLVGEGPEREKLVEEVCRLGLKNVQFRSYLPKDQMRKDMAESDLLIGSLPDLPHFRKYGMISTKLLDYLAAHRPVVFATTIQDHLISKAGAGFIVPPNSPQTLAMLIIRVASMSSQELDIMGGNGMRYIKENHDVELLAKRLESLL